MKESMQTQTLTKTHPGHRDMMNAVFITLLALSLFMLMTTAANATNSAMGSALCHIVLIVYGNLGRGLATLAVVVIGVGATLGKASWGLAITVAVGIAVVFNAHTVVGYLGAGGTGCINGDAW